MNQNQIDSLIRSVFKIVGAVLTARGMILYANLLNMETVIGPVCTLVGILSSLNWHKSPSSPNSSSSGGAASILLALALPVLFLTGCGTTAQRAAYQSAGTAVVSVDKAMTVWGDYVAQYHPGTNAEAKVKAAFEKYQASAVVLADAGSIYAASGTTNGPTAAVFTQAVSQSGQTLLDLENLITSFGAKLQ